LRAVLTERFWKFESLLRLAMLVLMSICAGVFIGFLAAQPLAQASNLDPNFVAQVMGFMSVQGLGLVWVSMFVSEHDLTWSGAFGLYQAPARSVGVATGVMLMALPFALIVLGGAISSLYKLLDATPESQVTVSFIRNGPPGWQLVILGFAAIVLVPIAEEALFRGIIYTALKQRGYRRLALWGNATLFALIHFNIGALVPLLFLALVWTWLYERTGNLLAPIAGHMIFNAVNFALLTMKLPPWLDKAVNP